MTDIEWSAIILRQCLLGNLPDLVLLFCSLRSADFKPELNRAPVSHSQWVWVVLFCHDSGWEPDCPLDSCSWGTRHKSVMPLAWPRCRRGVTNPDLLHLPAKKHTGEGKRGMEGTEQENLLQVLYIWKILLETRVGLWGKRLRAGLKSLVTEHVICYVAGHSLTFCQHCIFSFTHPCTC